MPWDKVGNIRGPQGTQGPTGSAGAKGDKGDKGDTGAAGSSASATTSASDLTTGTLAPARLPLVMGAIRTNLAHAGGTFTPDAAVGGNIGNLGINADMTMNPPINPADGQIIRYRVRANGALRRFTFGTSFVRNPAVAAFYDIPRGQILDFLMEYMEHRQNSSGTADPRWSVTAATLSG